MNIDYCLLMSAGHGTRMGEIGKSLPKLLWPIGRKTLLDLQIEYYSDLGIQNFFINTHHLHEMIFSYVEKSHFKDRVELIHEPKLLGNGGAVHNIGKKLNYKGRLLIANSDQFTVFTNKQWKIFSNETAKRLLVTIPVDTADGYNLLKLDGSQILDIEPKKSKSQRGVTYAGVSLIQLEDLEPVEGFSHYFETVADFRKNDVHTFPLGQGRYWDFGTLQRYLETNKRLYSHLDENDAFISFIKESGTFKFENEQIRYNDFLFHIENGNLSIYYQNNLLR